jgi:hypothetical protein
MDKHTLIPMIRRVYRYTRNVKEMGFPADLYTKFEPLVNRYKDETEYQVELRLLMMFDYGKLWNKSYMGVSQHESICAVSSELWSMCNYISKYVERQQPSNTLITTT